MVFLIFFDSDALDSSVFECRVYAKHKVGRDDFIGGTKETVESLLAKGIAGGLCVPFLNPFL
jgi:hypothetical protein